MSDKKLKPDLWTPRSADETRAIYDDWAARYDDDLAEAGYLTPARVARALAEAWPERDSPILDFGCGTGLSGEALSTVGFTTFDGTDISSEMLEHARAKGLYRKLWENTPGEPLGVAPGEYGAIAAIGVVSLGAAPPETLDMLIDTLAPGGLLALSYNDATLGDAAYLERMKTACATTVELVSEAYGPHLNEQDMGSTVYVLRRR